MSRLLVVVAVGLSFVVCDLHAARPDRVFPEGKAPADSRLETVRQLGDKYHPWSPPSTRKAWVAESKRVRRQLKVATGLWPAWSRGPVQAVIHGRVDRGDYTIEKVYFSSIPGHYVTGNLYRPKRANGRRPGILCPHGHWPNGRFHDAGAAEAAKQLKAGAEKFESGARFPLQARMVHLARMGCVVFHYDMVGYADSMAMPHRTGFGDVAAVLRLQNLMGLQTHNSIRAIDFLESLPDVDKKRIAVTGASGGGTQTFMLCALDPRPRVAFPAVMVSTGMQGGCVCENCSFLRPGINNITIAALFAPRPMSLSGADDWTIDIETKGLPELKAVYGLYGKSELIHAKCYPQFGHNYNQVSREMMYSWMNRHLELGLDEPIRERNFEPMASSALKVFDGDHPQPRDAMSLEQYRAAKTQLDDRRFSELLAGAKKGLSQYRKVVGGAAEVLLSGPTSTQCRVVKIGQGQLPVGGTFVTGTVSCGDQRHTIPWTLLKPAGGSGKPKVVAWFDGRGKAALFDEAGKPKPAVGRLLATGHTVFSADLYLTGEMAPGKTPVARVATHDSFIGYTYGYNLPPLTHRVRDILTVVPALSGELGVAVKGKKSGVHLVGTGGAGAWVLLARAAMSRGRRSRGLTIADVQGFAFSRITRGDDPMLLPGALKYGGLGGLAALSAPSRLVLGGVQGVPETELMPLTRIYQVADGKLTLEPKSLSSEAIVSLLLAE